MKNPILTENPTLMENANRMENPSLMENANRMENPSLLENPTLIATKNIFKTASLLVLTLCLALFLLPVSIQAQDEHAEEEMVRGPHGGRLLQEGNFAIELAIFEQGVPPEYRAWAYLDGEELALDAWNLTVTLTRLGGQIDRFSFTARNDYQQGTGIVEEPHSFDVSVVANYQRRTHNWEFESHEGRVEISSGVAETMGIGVHTATTQLIHPTELLYGKISPDPKQVSHLRARYPGLIQTVNPGLGDVVIRGDLIATVEANDSLQTYEIRAPISGTVVDIHANPGEYAGDQPLLTIANYENVWADLNVFPGDVQRVQAGQAVLIHLGEISVPSTIRFLNPGEGLSPHVIARVPLPNPDLLWTPGLLVEAAVTVDQFEVELAIDNRAIQQFRDWQVVFIQIGDSYEIRPLTLGRSDGQFSEVLEGLNSGDRYVVENSYLLKADLEKSGASHDH